MFSNIDDLLKIFKDKLDNKSVKEKEIINLILKDNDLSQLVFELKEAGYEPSIKRQACRKTFLGITLENIIFIIKSQQLVPDEIDGSVSVSSDVVYNNMNKVFNTFNNQIFKKEHLSFYSNQDISILDENRTCLLYTSPSPRDLSTSRMPSSA